MHQTHALPLTHNKLKVMQKHHSFQLPRVSPDSPRHKYAEYINEQVAEDSLFEISKNEETHGVDTFWKQISKLSLAKKRLQKGAASAPKKKQVELLPVVDITTFRHSNHDLNLSILNTTSYMVIDERKAKYRPKEVEKNLLQEHINRKAKYLFRSRNKAKLPINPRNDPFSSSFYCSKLTPENP